MASEEHKSLAQYVKEVHALLRKSTSQLGASAAWEKHCENKERLQKYAQCMAKLATEHWDVNNTKEKTLSTSRIKWTTDVCFNYFILNNYEIHREKEMAVASKLNLPLQEEIVISTPLKLIDVGSCYNPFKVFEFMDVFAIDLCPANETVFQCDFLNIPLDDHLVIHENKAIKLPRNYYEAVAFCFLLEYIPTPEMRVCACEKAYEILRPGGLLIINTPDSKHVGANSKTMKCWRYTLAIMGFTRIKYEKLAHMHCMAFRKAINKDTAVRWATIHKELFMEYTINIPQDFIKDKCEENNFKYDIEVSTEDFMELPFPTNGEYL